jgi:hypothetical protein
VSVALYMDENVDEKITIGLRRRGVDVVMVQEDGMRGRPDPEVLDRATTIRRIAVSEDSDFLAEATRRQRAGEGFGGVIRVPQGLAVGTSIDNLEMIARVNSHEDHADRVVYLPL